MGRQVRMVPRGWEHPKYDNGDFIPLMKGPFAEAAAEWDEENEHWSKGEILDYDYWPEQRRFKPGDTASSTYVDYAGERPVEAGYMPTFPEGTATMLMMYEDTSEGTPISPAFETPEELARWLAETGASAFGGMTATYEQWLATCKAGWSVGMVIANGRMMSGVEAEQRLKQ